jgi:hypothetical protein
MKNKSNRRGLSVRSTAPRNLLAQPWNPPMCANPASSSLRSSKQLGGRVHILLIAQLRPTYKPYPK